MSRKVFGIGQAKTTDVKPKITFLQPVATAGVDARLLH
jgi:hypothetical protein